MSAIEPFTLSIEDEQLDDLKRRIDMTRWPEMRRRKLFDQYLPTGSERYFWDSILQYVYEGNIDTWDYQFVYSMWANSGLSIAPSRNLVRNIGFSHADATHTTAESVYSSLQAEELSLPLAHPSMVLVSSDIDEVEARLRNAQAGGLPYPLNKYIASALGLLAKRAGRQR